MNILVCFSVVPELEMMFAEDWVVDADLHIDVGFLKCGLNCFDESALETALKFRDAAEQRQRPTCLSALTIAGSEADPVARSLLALRFDRVVRIDPPTDMRFHPFAAATLISRYVARHAAQDVVMMGWQSGIGQNAQTPLLTAEMLGWPCITQVTGAAPAHRRHLAVASRTDDGRLEQTVQAPCLLSVANAPHSCLRVPTLKDRMRHGKRPIETMAFQDIDTAAEPIALCALHVIRRTRNGVCIEGDGPEEKAKALYHDYLKQRLAPL